ELSGVVGIDDPCGPGGAAARPDEGEDGDEAAARGGEEEETKEHGKRTGGDEPAPPGARDGADRHARGDLDEPEEKYPGSDDEQHDDRRRAGPHEGDDPGEERNDPEPHAHYDVGTGAQHVHEGGDPIEDRVDPEQPHARDEYLLEPHD